MLNWLVLLISASVIEARERIYINSVVPNTGPITGNTRVIVRGTNMEPNEEYPIPLCKFGTKSRIVHGTYVTCTPLPRNPDDPEPTTADKISHCIECDPSPPAAEDDMIPFLVSITGDFSDVENSVEFEYYIPPVVDYIVPMYGQKNGGTTVTVYGQNFIDFDQYLRCFFGTKAVPGIFISDSVMHCVSPFSDIVIAAMPFKITLNDQQTNKEDITYYYYPEPAIMKLTPNRSPTSGGIEVEIEGQNLDPFNDLDKVDNHNNTFCRFGKDAVVQATVISDGKVMCIAPPNPVGRTVLVDVTLNNADMVLNEIDWTDDHLPFEYYAPTYIYDIQPNVGLNAGNNSIIIYGNNFNSSMDIKCKFGNKIITGTFIDSNRIACDAPAADSPGSVDLSVSIGDYNFGNTLKYTYFATAELASISPTCGPRTGYTQVTVTGKNFAYIRPENVKCVFGGIESTPATIISATEIKCDSPDIHLKPYYKQTYFNFTVTLNGDDISKSANTLQFAYYDFHSLSKVTPNFGPVDGGTPIAVSGGHFKQAGVCNVTARFGSLEIVSSSYNDTEVLVNTPTVGVPGTSIVQISLNGQQFTDYEGPKNLGGSKLDEGRVEFYFYGKPLPTGFFPLGGPSTGNSMINIYGAGFGEEGNPVYVRFSYSANSTVFAVIECDDVDLNQVKCLSPKANPNTIALLELSRNGVNYQSIADYTYLFYDAPTVSTISPTMGPVKNDVGGNITVIGTKFKCTTDDCSQLTCQYGTSPYPLYMQGYLADSTHILCPIISYSRPEVIIVEISLNGIDFTNNGQTYTFFDAFVLSALPRYFTEKGGTAISVLGFGFANTGSELLCQFGSSTNPLLCKGVACVFPGVFVSDHEIKCTTPARADVTYQQTGLGLGFEKFAVEISIKAGVFTTSNITVWYMKDASISVNTPTSGSANGYTYLIFQTNFYWESNSKDQTMRYAAVRCHFYSSTAEVYMDGSIIVYPFLSTGDPNALACLSPPWASAATVNLEVTVNGKDYFGGFFYTYVEKISISMLSPSCGPDRGETKVAVQGTGFNDLAGLHFKWGTESRVASTETLFLDASGYITGYSPATKSLASNGGFVYVEIGHNVDLQTTEDFNYTTYIEYTHNRMQFLYYQEPTLNYLYPRGGSEKGGTIVTLAGSFFVNYEAVLCTPQCRFGTIVVPGEFVSTVIVRCPSPPQAPGTDALVGVEISFNGYDWSQSNLTFLYFKTPVIYSIMPLSGPGTGGTMIAVSGANFTGDSLPEEFSCKFTPVTGNLPRRFVPGMYKDDSLVYCPLPGGWTSGTEVKIDVTFNGIDFTNSNVKFNIFQIDAVLPRSGPTTGSSAGITVYGSGFIPNDNATCIIENKDVKPTVLTWGKMVCPIPPTPSGENFFGRVPLEITVNGIDYSKFPQGFQYYPQPVVTAVEPLSGPVSGGSMITVYGGPFKASFDSANVTCAIGDFYSAAIMVDDHTLQCISPAMERPKNGSSLPVHISLNGQDYTNNTHFYSVYGLLDSAPKGGPFTGGTEVMVKGFGFFNNEPRCRFGIESNNIVVEAKLIDENHLICTVPSGFKIPTGSQLPLDIPLEIGFSDGKFHPWTRTDNKFRLYENPKILSMAPVFGYVDLRYEVNIVADPKKGFYPALTGWKSNNELDVMHSIVCRFGSFGDVPAVYINRTNIRCLTPDTKMLRKDLHQDTVVVQLALNGQDFIEVGNYTFKGSASGLWVVLMWLGLVILIVAIVVLLGILISKYYDGLPLPEALRGLFPQPIEEGRVSAASGPHVLRQPDGNIRPSSVQAPPNF